MLRRYKLCDILCAVLAHDRAVLARAKQPRASLSNSKPTPKPSKAEDFITRWGAAPPATAMLLTTDHNAIMGKEKKRIEAAGGRVEDGRVNGMLEVSRSFGDLYLKKFGVISTPDTRIHFKIEDTDEFLLLVCLMILRVCGCVCGCVCVCVCVCGCVGVWVCG